MFERGFGDRGKQEFDEFITQIKQRRADQINALCAANGIPIRRRPEGGMDYDALSPKDLLDWIGNPFGSQQRRLDAYKALQIKLQGENVKAPGIEDILPHRIKWIKKGANYFGKPQDRQIAREVLEMLRSLQPTTTNSDVNAQSDEQQLLDHHEAYWRERLHNPFSDLESKRNAEDALNFLAEQRNDFKG